MSGVHEGLHADVERDCERRNVLVYLPQGQTLQLLLPEDMTRLRIQELVAQRLGFETSQIRLVDSVQPPPAGLCLQVEVRANDYAMEMNSWPRHPLKQELIVFVQENLDMRSLPTTPDKTWPVLSFMRTGAFWMCLSCCYGGTGLLAANARTLSPHGFFAEARTNAWGFKYASLVLHCLSSGASHINVFRFNSQCFGFAFRC